MEVDIDVPTFFRQVEDAAPESLQGMLFQMEDLWERRLWHQLTVALETYFNDPLSEGSRMRMFKDFVGTFAKNINQSKLVGLGLLARQECKGTRNVILANETQTRG
jgi:26S proteasome regulatory subunit N9